MIFVSPDGERSMNTYLGISSELGPEDVADHVAGQAEILFLEGYLYDKDKGKAAFERAAKLCRENGGRAGIALSDPFCVDRHRNDFRRLVKELDYVIGNEHEWESLYQTDLSTALEQASKRCGPCRLHAFGSRRPSGEGRGNHLGPGQKGRSGRRHWRGRPVRRGVPLWLRDQPAARHRGRHGQRRRRPR